MREMWEALSIEVPFSEIVPLPPSNGITSPSPAVQVKTLVSGTCFLVG
jgi:hypothetical protein